MTESTPERAVRAGPIIGGLLLGALVWLIWVTVTLIIGLSAAYGTESDAVAVAALVVVAIPLVLAVVLLVRPGMRQVGAGFVMGLAIGFIVGAGVCVTPLVLGAF